MPPVTPLPPWSMPSCRPFYELHHPPDGFFHPPEHRVTDDGMADVELFDFWNGGHGLDVLVGQTVPGVDGEADLLRMGCRAPQCIQRSCLTTFSRRISS